METEKDRTKKPKKHLIILLIVIIAVVAFTGNYINKSMKINAGLSAALGKVTDHSQESGNASHYDEYVLTGVLSPVYSYNITAKVSGQVTEIYKAKGDKVQVGAVLVSQDATDVKLSAGQGSTTDELLQRLKVAYDSAEDIYQKNKVLYQAGAIPESTLTQLENQRENARLLYEGTSKAISEQTSKTQIKSPGNGIVSSLSIQLGEYATAGTAIASVTDTSKLILKGNVPEKMLKQISKGDIVEVHMDSLGKTFDGVVTFISPVSVASGQMFPVEITVNNPEEEIKAGMSASAKIN